MRAGASSASAGAWNARDGKQGEAALLVSHQAEPQYPLRRS